MGVAAAGVAAGGPDGRSAGVVLRSGAGAGPGPQAVTDRCGLGGVSASAFVVGPACTCRQSTTPLSTSLVYCRPSVCQPPLSSAGGGVVLGLVLQILDTPRHVLQLVLHPRVLSYVTSCDVAFRTLSARPWLAASARTAVEGVGGSRDGGGAARILLLQYF